MRWALAAGLYFDVTAKTEYVDVVVCEFMVEVCNGETHSPHHPALPIPQRAALTSTPRRACAARLSTRGSRRS